MLFMHFMSTCIAFVVESIFLLKAYMNEEVKYAFLDKNLITYKV